KSKRRLATEGPPVMADANCHLDACGRRVLVWLRRRKETASISIPIAIAPIPDLSDTAAASERSEDEWFALANRLEGEGELRLALRAAYFGLLAGLAQRQWL